MTKMTQITTITRKEDEAIRLNHINALVRQQAQFMSTETAAIAIYQDLIDSHIGQLAESGVSLVRDADGQYVVAEQVKKPARRAEKPAPVAKTRKAKAVEHSPEYLMIERLCTLHNKNRFMRVENPVTKSPMRLYSTVLDHQILWRVLN